MFFVQMLNTSTTDPNFFGSVSGNSELIFLGLKPMQSRAFFLSILWPKFGYIPNGKSYLFPPIFVPKFPIPKSRKISCQTNVFRGRLKQEKMLY